MVDIRRQTVALVGQVIEDVTYAVLNPLRFTATLVGTRHRAQYKPGGYFVFTNLSPGQYTLRLQGAGFQPQAHPVSVPFPSLLFVPPGDNELAVVVRTLNNGSNRITFDPFILPQAIRAGAPVLAQGVATSLAVGLDQGRITEARLATLAGLTVGAIVRITRDSSIRLRFSPYTPLPAARTRLVGNVVRQDTPDVPLPGVQVRMTQVNGVDIITNDIAGVPIATVDLQGTRIVLGLERDITTLANDQGDYNLYFDPLDALNSVSLRVTFAGYQPQTITASISPGQREKIDFQLARA